MISIVIPVYNEGEPLIQLCNDLTSVLKTKFDRHEIILVDDRSQDSSWDVMRRLADSNKDIKIARLSRNFGQHSALTAGLSLSKGDHIVMMDCDGQDDPKHITMLFDTLQTRQVHIVYAKRKNRQDAIVKRLSSRFINSVLQRLSGNRHDPEVGTYRIMTRFAVQSYLSLPEKKRFVGGLFYWLNLTSDSIAVEHKSRTAGRSTYTLRKLVKLSRLGIINSSTTLLSLATYLGLFSSGVSLALGAYFLIRKFIYEIPIGFTAIIVSIFFVGGMIMLLLGIIGEYLREIFEEVKARPNFIIEEKQNFDI